MAPPKESLRLHDDVKKALEPFLPGHRPLRGARDHDRVDDPFITVTYASSLDSMIAIAPNHRTAISGEESKAMTHYLRYVHDAIVVGVNTAITDDPTLNSRLREAQKHGLEAQPRPVVLDMTGRWDAHKRSNMVAAAIQGKGKGPWVYIHAKYVDKLPQARRDLIDDCGGAYIVFDHPDSLIMSLGARGMRSIMIEGGANVINTYLSKHLHKVNSIIITLAPVMFGNNGVNVQPKSREETPAVSFEESKWIPLGRDVVMCGRPAPDVKGDLSWDQPPANLSLMPQVPLANGIEQEQHQTETHERKTHQRETYAESAPKTNGVEWFDRPCYACGEIGHMQKDCPLVKRNAMTAEPPDTQTRADLDESVGGTPAPDDPKNVQTAGTPMPMLAPAWTEQSGYVVNSSVQPAQTPRQLIDFEPTDHTPRNTTSSNIQPTQQAEPIIQKPQPPPLEPTQPKQQPAQPIVEQKLAVQEPPPTQASQPATKESQPPIQESQSSSQYFSWADDTPIAEHPPPTPPWEKRKAAQSSNQPPAAAAVPASAPAPPTGPQPTEASSHDDDPQEAPQLVPSNPPPQPSEELNWEAPSPPTVQRNPSRPNKNGPDIHGIPPPDTPGSVFSTAPSKYANDPDPPTTPASRNRKPVLKSSELSSNADDDRSSSAPRGRDRDRPPRGKPKGFKYSWEPDTDERPVYNPNYADRGYGERGRGRGRGRGRFEDVSAPRGRGRGRGAHYEDSSYGRSRRDSARGSHDSYRGSHDSHRGAHDSSRGSHEHTHRRGGGGSWDNSAGAQQDDWIAYYKDDPQPDWGRAPSPGPVDNTPW